MRHIIVFLLVVFSLLSVACTSKLPSFRPYKMDIQQGNVVTSKMMLQLRPGMTKSQVRFIMGTPLIQDSFHSNRWDYFYQMRKEGKIIEQRRVILDFDKDALTRVRGDVIPAGTGDPEAKPTTGTEPVSQPDDKRGLIDKLKFWNKDEKKEKTRDPQAAPSDLVLPAGQQPASKEPVMPAVPSEAPAAVTKPDVTEPAPAEPAPVPAIAPEPITDPAEPTSKIPEPVKAQEPVAPTVEPVVEPTVEPATEPKVTPEPKPEPVVQPAPQKPIEAPQQQTAPEPVAEPEAKPAEKAAPKPAAAPAPEKAPPQEDEPGYFEYMLEKIGF